MNVKLKNVKSRTQWKEGILNTFYPKYHVCYLENFELWISFGI